MLVAEIQSQAIRSVPYPYPAHILPMSYPCPTHILPMSCPWPTRAIPMSYSCPTHALWPSGTALCLGHAFTPHWPRAMAYGRAMPSPRTGPKLPTLTNPVIYSYALTLTLALRDALSLALALGCVGITAAPITEVRLPQSRNP